MLTLLWLAVVRTYDVAAAAPASQRICVVSSSRGKKFQQISTLLDQNKQEYCNACGYKCILTNETAHAPGRRPEWDKIPLLQQVLRDSSSPEVLPTVSPVLQNSCDVAIFMDADMVIIRPFMVPSLSEQFLVAAKDAQGTLLSFPHYSSYLFDPCDDRVCRACGHPGMNVGMMVLKAGEQSRQLLAETFARTEFVDSLQCEQKALRQSLILRDETFRSQVQLFTGVVSYSLRQDLLPIYHAAGCFSSRSRTYGVCHNQLKVELRRVNMSQPCDALTAAELGTLAAPAACDLLQAGQGDGGVGRPVVLNSSSSPLERRGKCNREAAKVGTLKTGRRSR